MQAFVASAQYFRPQWIGKDAKVGGGRRTDSIIYTIILATGSHKDQERGWVTPNPPKGYANVCQVDILGQHFQLSLGVLTEIQVPAIPLALWRKNINNMEGAVSSFSMYVLMSPSTTVYNHLYPFSWGEGNHGDTKIQVQLEYQN